MLKGDPSIGGFEPTVSVFENFFPLYAEKKDQTTSLTDTVKLIFFLNLDIQINPEVWQHSYKERLNIGKNPLFC